MSNKEVKSSNDVKQRQDDKEQGNGQGQVPWKKVAKGIPVEAGKNWVTGLTHEQRVQAMVNHENFWKKRYNAQRGTVGLQQNWTRG